MQMLMVDPFGRRRRRRGLTLIELVVVIAILAILAGIIVVLLPDMLNRAQNVTYQSNLTELDRVIVEYHAIHNGEYPDGMDSLINGSGQLYGGLPTIAATAVAPAVNPALTVRTATTSHVNRLKRAGITVVQQMKATPASGFGATFFAYSDTGGVFENPQTIAVGTPLAFLTASTGYGMKFQLAADREYLVLGIGQACEMVGQDGMVKEAPVLLHVDGCKDPETKYCRAYALFDLGVPFTGGRDNGIARYLGTFAMGDTAFRFSEEMTNIPNRF